MSVTDEEFGEKVDYYFSLISRNSEESVMAALLHDLVVEVKDLGHKMDLIKTAIQQGHQED